MRERSSPVCLLPFWGTRLMVYSHAFTRVRVSAAPIFSDKVLSAFPVLRFTHGKPPATSGKGHTLTYARIGWRVAEDVLARTSPSKCK